MAFQLFIKNLIAKFQRMLVIEGPVTKPEIIERIDGYVTEVSEWKTYKEAKEAMVKLSDGTVVSVFVPPPVEVNSGDYINISAMEAGDSERFYVYMKHLIGIGSYSSSPLPQHRTYGSVYGA